MSEIRIDALQKSFMDTHRQRVPVIDIKHMVIESTAQVALEGHSGCGKTTLLHLIAGILQPDAGRIEVDGENVVRLNERQRDLWRAKHVGYVFQHFNLLQGYTALENVILAMALSGAVSEARAKELLKRMGLEELMHYKPRQLSIGQQQRVAVARALANKPGIVLADEPTGNLDEGNAQETIHLIKEVCQENKATLIVVSHDPMIVKQFDKRINLLRLQAVIHRKGHGS